MRKNNVVKSIFTLLVCLYMTSCSTDNTDQLVTSSKVEDSKAIDKPLSRTNVDLQWKKINVNTTEALNRVAFYSNSVGFILGNNGLLLKTDNGGASWNKVTTNVTHHLRTISFHNNQIMINGLKSNDSGNTWTPESTTNFLGAYYVGENHLLAQSLNFDGRMYESKDNGASWIQKSIPRKRGGRGHKDGVFKGNIGYFGSWYPGELLRTEDSGNTWTRVYHGYNRPQGKRRFYGYTLELDTEGDYVYAATANYLLKINMINNSISIISEGLYYKSITVDKDYIAAIALDGNKNVSIVSNDGGKTFKKQNISALSNNITLNNENVFTVGLNGALWQAKR